MERPCLSTCLPDRESRRVGERERERKELGDYEGSRESALIFQTLIPGSHEAWLPMGSMRAAGSQLPSSNFPFFA